MWRLLAVITLCACSVSGVGCDDGFTRSSHPSVAVEFTGRVVNVDTGDPVGNVRVSVEAMGFVSEPGFNMQPDGWVMPTDSVTSGGDGTFTLRLTVRRNWSTIDVKLTGPGYDEKRQRFDRTRPLPRPDITMYPALAIRLGESIDVRVEEVTPNRWPFGACPCRQVLVDASPGEPVEVEIISDDASKPMGLAANPFDEEAVPRLTIEPDSYIYVYGVGTARLTARR